MQKNQVWGTLAQTSEGEESPRIIKLKVRPEEECMFY